MFCVVLRFFVVGIFELSFFPCKAGLFGKNPMPKND